MSGQAYLPGVRVGFYRDATDGMSLSMAEHWNGTSWNVTLPPAVGDFASGTGTKLLVLHWNGSSWTRHAAPTPGSSSDLVGVAALSARDVWAVGSFSTTGGTKTLIEHWNAQRVLPAGATDRSAGGQAGVGTAWAAVLIRSTTSFGWETIAT
jgi:hypothetical protein